MNGLTSGLPRSIHVQEASMKRTISPSAKRVQRPGGRSGLGRNRLVIWVSAFVLTCVVLSSCADDTSDRRFANETPLTADASLFTPTATLAPSSITAAAGPVILSPEALIVSRGAPAHFYVRSGNSLLAFSADGASRKTVWKGKEGELLGVTSSPNGDRAAILTRTKDRYDVVVVDSSGKKLKTFNDVHHVLEPGTPTPVSGAGRDLIDWSPQGNQLLAAFASGGIIRLPLDGDPAVVLGRAKAPGPLDVQWSPAGDAIAYVGRVDSASVARLFAVNVNGQGNEPVELYPKDTATTSSVVEAKWLPNASAILFTRTSPEDELPKGGDLFGVPAKGGGATLVASSARAAPVAAIEHVIASPNGRSIAYTVVVPGPDQPEFHSLWVQQLGTNRATRISTPPDETITEVWFVSNGIAYRTAPSSPKKGEEDSLGVYIVGPDQTRRQVYATGSLVPGTPEASPVASPVGQTPNPAIPTQQPISSTPTQVPPTSTPQG